MEQHDAFVPSPFAGDDRDLYASLKKESFEGPLWQKTAEALAHYGFTVIHAWLRSGEIFRQVLKLGRPVARSLPPGYVMSDDDTTDLVADTVMEGIRLFRRLGIEDRGWDPDSGASLRSYFIGSCLAAFSNAYRRWSREQWLHHSDRSAMLTDRVIDEPHEEQGFTDIENAEAISTALEGLNVIEKQIVWLYQSGYSHQEIAQMLDLNKEVVTKRIRLIRRRLRAASES